MKIIKVFKCSCCGKYFKCYALTESDPLLYRVTDRCTCDGCAGITDISLSDIRCRTKELTDNDYKLLVAYML